MGKTIKLNRWQLTVSGLIGLVLAYLIVSRALDTGSWWQYFGTLILLILSVRMLGKAFKKK